MSSSDTVHIKTPHKANVVIVSTITEDWGGSEELWSRSIPYLQAANFNVLVFKPKINRNHPEFAELAKKGVKLIDLEQAAPDRKQIYKRIIGLTKRLYTKLKPQVFESAPAESSFIRNVRTYTPKLVIIAQGINFDGTDYAYQCSVHKIPYVLICQKAVDFYWPQAHDRPFMIQAFKDAKKLFFVSKHNHRLTEEQFGVNFPNSQIVFNPVKVSRSVLPYPSVDTGYRLACVGRLFLLDKGQDMLLRILSQQKWMQRPLSVSFIGKGIDEDGLTAMARFLKISKVEFVGHIDNVEDLWSNYHALVLPSRSEGLPLSMVEAMAAGRPVIVSKAGGTAELVQDGYTGFTGQANEESFDDAMERAWENRGQWEVMGKNASKYIAEHIPLLPEKHFADHLTAIIHE